MAGYNNTICGHKGQCVMAEYRFFISGHKGISAQRGVVSGVIAQLFFVRNIVLTAVIAGYCQD